MTEDAIHALCLTPRKQVEAHIAHLPWGESMLIPPAHWIVGGTGLAMILTSLLMRVAA